MIIKTKFDKNQWVWIIDINNDKWHVVGKYLINGIETINDDRIPNYSEINYSLEYKKGFTIELPEDVCFLTKEEAQEECDRRNNK